MAAKATSAINTEQPMRRRPLGTVDVLDEHPRRGEEISGVFLEMHVPKMPSAPPLTTFLSLICQCADCPGWRCKFPGGVCQPQVAAVALPNRLPPTAIT